jgi:CTP:molybdopterin cytidylyltransferase MocA
VDEQFFPNSAQVTWNGRMSAYSWMWTHREITTGFWRVKMAFRVSAIILAAGKSQRMGQPKMVLPWRGTTVLGRVVEVFSAAGVRNLFIVTGGDREKVEQEITRLKNTFPVTPVYNPDHGTSGMLSSIWAGLNAIPHDSEAVLIMTSPKWKLPL